MTTKEIINGLQNILDYCRYHQDAPALREAIEMLKCSEIPNSSDERTDKRTETHACDLIDRQQAIDALHMHLMYRMGTDSNKKRLDDWINSLPSAQPDLSEYSDKLWRNAYERGKRDAQPEIIRCKDCKYYREYGYVNGTSKFLPKCTFNSIYVNADDFCSRAEKKEE